MESLRVLFQKSLPLLGVLFLQAVIAVKDIIFKVALNEGMSSYVLVAYRFGFATIVMAPFAWALERNTAPKMTIPIFLNIMLLSLLEPVGDGILYTLSIKYTTATFVAAMSNILPAATFVLACVFRLEKVQFMNVRSQAKIIGTIATVAGALMMTLVKGPYLDLPWTRGGNNHNEPKGGVQAQHPIKGAIMITVGCLSWSVFMILQAITLKVYKAELSLTAWMCFIATVQGSVLAAIMERGNAAAWSLKWDAKLLAYVYSGVVGSGLAFYVQGLVMRKRGPVFVTAFSPLSMVMVAVISSFALKEKSYLGRVLGAVVIVLGLYFVVWGKSKDQQLAAEDDDEKEAVEDIEKMAPVVDQGMASKISLV